MHAAINQTKEIRKLQINIKFHSHGRYFEYRVERLPAPRAKILTYIIIIIIIIIMIIIIIIIIIICSICEI